MPSIVFFFMTLSALPSTDDPTAIALRELDRIVALPVDQQAKEMPKFYRESFVHVRHLPGLESVNHIYHPLMSKHRELLKPLVKADLKSKNADDVRRGLAVAGDYRMTDLYDEVADIFQKQPEHTDMAQEALRDLDDARAIPLLLNRHLGEPFRYVESLCHLCTGRPIEPKVFESMRSADAKTRRNALYAIFGSGDVRMIYEIPRLVKDTNPEVRSYVARTAFNLPKPAFQRVRSEIAGLLSDKDIDVRVDVACMFAREKDVICSRTLYELLRDNTMDQWRASRVWPAVRELTGTDFDRELESDWTPAKPANQAALKRFDEWIRKLESSPFGNLVRP